MKKRFVALAVILCLALAACGVGAPEPVLEPEEPTTEATEPETSTDTEVILEPDPEPTTEPATEAATEATTEPETEAVMEPETEASTEAATAAEVTPFYDSVTHPVYGQMGMTNMEREYTIRVAEGKMTLPWGLMNDPRYKEICGGFAYRGGTMHIFSLDNTAVDNLVREPLTAAGMPYHIWETAYSLNYLESLYYEIEANRELYDVESVRFMPRYNQLAVVRNDMSRIDPDLQALVDEIRCIEILDSPYTIDAEDAFSVLLDMLEDKHPELYSGVVNVGNGTTHYEISVTDIDRTLKAINADSEMQLAYIMISDSITFVQVEYSLKALHAAQNAVSDMMETLFEGGWYTHTAESTTIVAGAKGISDPAIQQQLKNAALAAVAQATGQSGESLKFEFVDEDVEILNAI
jgi:hypothetical protein